MDIVREKEGKRIVLTFKRKENVIEWLLISTKDFAIYFYKIMI
jgi:hypothetical protein